MKERGVLFNGEMVRAILEGHKTQTRRIMKVQPPDETYKFSTLCDTTAREERKHIGAHHFAKYDGFRQLDSTKYFRSPFGYKGDRLWVRENFSTDAITMYPCPKVWYQATEFIKCDGIHTCPKESRGKWADCLTCWEEENGKFRWRPSIHMPRKASRITLEITNIRVERLQDISDEDAKAEGVETMQNYADDQWLSCANVRFGTQPNKFKFGVLWDSIQEQNKWNENPWVWVVEFKKI